MSAWAGSEPSIYNKYKPEGSWRRSIVRLVWFGVKGRWNTDFPCILKIVIYSEWRFFSHCTWSVSGQGLGKIVRLIAGWRFSPAGMGARVSYTLKILKCPLVYSQLAAASKPVAMADEKVQVLMSYSSTLCLWPAIQVPTRSFWVLRYWVSASYSS